MIDKKRVFISSVQKELELERTAAAALISSDPFLVQHCTPVLFEKEPAAPHPRKEPYLDILRSCNIYLLVIGNEYGESPKGLSATHQEYHLAQKLSLPTIVFLKGKTDGNRSPDTRALIEEIKETGHTYKRFHDREDLKPELLRALIRTLAEEFGIKATAAEVSEGEHLIESASPFELAPLTDVSVDSLDQALIEAFGNRILAGQPTGEPSGKILHSRGLAVRGEKAGVFHATAGAFILFAPRPASRFPQCEILVDAYDDVRISGRPKGQANVNAPLPLALDDVIAFIDTHTFHPRRVVGLNNIRLDEYPVSALREALLNAVAHRSYDDASRKVAVRLFSDRLEIASPGYPLKPLTLAKLRKGNYRPCSRNPVIAQTLSVLDKMEQRGSGFARMRDAMLDHGLSEPVLDQQDGFFIVTLFGPAGDYDRLRTPAHAPGFITPAIEAKLNERQKRIIKYAQEHGEVTSGWCRKEFGVTYDTANRDLLSLAEMRLMERIGRGRSTKFRMVQTP